MLSAPRGYTPLGPTSSTRPCPPPGFPLSRLFRLAARLLARPVAAFFRVLVLRFFAIRPPSFHRPAVAASAALSRTCRNSAGSMPSTAACATRSAAPPSHARFEDVQPLPRHRLVDR